MKVAVILLTLDRLELTKRVIDKNFYNSGLDADVFLIDNGSTKENFEAVIKHYPYFKKTYQFKKNKGIATAINKGIEFAKGYDAVVTLANDILMPQNWLINMVNSIKEDTGCIGIHCVEGLPDLVDGYHYSQSVFGNVLIAANALKAVGKFNTDFDPYGMQDADYCYRLHKSGFKNYYLPNLKSEHIGHDVGNGTEYRKMKDDSLAKAGEIWTKAIEHYEKTNNYYL
jgi:GT2 family glycosyltransferase